MNNVLILEGGRDKQMMAGWGLSIILHGCLVLAAFTLMPKMTRLLEQEPFQWQVVLVEAPREAATAPPAKVQERTATPAPSKPQRQPPRPTEPAQQMVTRQVQPRDVPQPIQREVQATAESVQPVHRPEPTPAIVKVQPQETRPQETQQTEPILNEVTPAEVARTEVGRDMAVTAMPQPAVQPVPSAVETREVPVEVASQPPIETHPEAAVLTRPPAVSTPESAPVVHETEPVTSAPPVSHDLAAVSQPVPELSAPITSAPPAPALSEAVPPTGDQAPVVARSVTPKPPTRADFGWLAESLHRRIVELRHYPSTARLNGWQGKVVLRVAIKQDGHLEDVSVVKSSGHETLDNAAMEAVRRACPLHLKYELERPKVVMHLPVTYSLNQ